MAQLKMPAKPEWLRAGVSSRAVGVDRAAKVLRGYVAAQLGPFKSFGRGEFDEPALREIVKLANAKPQGLKARFTHPSMSDDGLGKFLGRARDFRMDKALDARTGKTVPAVRADLHFDPTALDTPPNGGKPLGEYVMDLATSDPDAISSSLVLRVEELYRMNKDGTPQTDQDGNPLPPIWIPKELHASDIVDTGDAVDGLLSAGELCQALSVGLTPELEKLLRFDNAARLGAQLLDGMFRGQSREVVEARCGAWLARYLALRFGDDEPAPTPKLDELRLKLERMRLTTRELARKG